MLQPNQTKYRKQFKGRNRGVATRGTQVNFGQFGLKAITSGFITSRQLEAGRRVLTRYMKRSGSVWIRLFPDKPITKKPAEVRQGKGKGNVEHWAAVVPRGRIIFEISGISPVIAQKALKLAGDKLPVQTSFAKRTIL